MAEPIDPDAEPSQAPATDYVVGYGKPPVATRFQPGQSGNKRGRPRGAKGLKSELADEMNEWVTITVEGKPKRIRKRRLIIKALAAKAAKGNVAAADKLLSLIIQAEGFEDQRRATKPLSDTDQLILAQFLGDDEEPAPLGLDDAAGEGGEGDDA